MRGLCVVRCNRNGIMVCPKRLSALFDNAGKAKRRCAEKPSPVFYAVVLPAGLIYIQNRLGWNTPLEFFIGPGNNTEGYPGIQVLAA